MGCSPVISKLEGHPKDHSPSGPDKTKKKNEDIRTEEICLLTPHPPVGVDLLNLMGPYT